MLSEDVPLEGLELLPVERAILSPARKLVRETVSVQEIYFECLESVIPAKQIVGMLDAEIELMPRIFHILGDLDALRNTRSCEDAIDTAIWKMRKTLGFRYRMLYYWLEKAGYFDDDADDRDDQPEPSDPFPFGSGTRLKTTLSL